MTLNEKLTKIKYQLTDLIYEDTCYGKNPFQIQITRIEILPTFDIAIIKIEYRENYLGEYLESNWYNNQITDGLIGNYDLGNIDILFRDELDNIEVSIVNLNDKQGNPLTQQLIIIA